MRPLILESQTAVVVLSSDTYSDVWPIQFRFWFNNSPFTSLPLFLVSGSIIYADSRVTTLLSERHNDAWSDRVTDAIRRIEYPYIILLTEDLLCLPGSNIADLNNAIGEFLHLNAKVLALTPSVSSVKILGSDLVRSIPSWAMHRVSLQMSLWKRQYLLELLQPNETPWQFELNGTSRSRHYDGFVCGAKALVNYVEVIGKGKYTREGLSIIKNQFIDWHSERMVFSRKEQLFRNYGHLKAKLFSIFPTKLQDYLIRNGYIGKEFC
jgi:hypothetical protein